MSRLSSSTLALVVVAALTQTNMAYAATPQTGAYAMPNPWRADDLNFAREVAPQGKDPQFARILSATGPLITTGVGFSVGTLLSGPLFGGAPGALLGLPFGYGLGQAYAGDGWRFLGVSAAGVGTILACGMVGEAINSVLHLSSSRGGFTFSTSTLGALFTLAGAIGYGYWASQDAYDTAERMNLETVEQPKLKTRK